MKRREFIAGAASILAGTLSTRAGAAAFWRIGQVFGGSSEIISSSGLEQGLSTLGYIDGKNIRLQTRFAAPKLNEMQAAVLALLPDIDLLVVWGTIGGVAAKAVAPNIPVVFISVGAPVDIGLVQSLAHPGGNMTGTTFEAASETYGKRLQLLKEILPDLSRVAVIGARNDPNFPFAMTSLGKSAPLMQISLTAVEVGSDDDLMRAFDRVKRDRLEAVIVVAGAFTYANSKAIADLALANGVPSCHGFKEIVAAGGLISLGPDLMTLARQGASLIDKIIQGARPADLPVEQPTRYLTSINLRTARSLGLSLSPALLASADEVIE
jgi:putative tryptophan/tyrosine transport system substrate-binding protein